MSKFPSQEMDRFNVRLPVGMRDAIADRAKRNGRSMNSEIIAALDSWLSGEPMEEVNQRNIDTMVRIATKAFTEEISKNYDLVPKSKDK
ncbi:Arc family DNA-binding protein [Klebsiella pneumoniae]|jgi:plasmid stability protein|uniref:Arc family DNA-binding protein n=1 Tax=Klebsiella pneumoniae TaxID=573 RepID=A0A483ZGL9_KLEPN|nr:MULTISPECIES: Arc family DNA-binding protein [Klebsiella]ELN2736631.1 Arc family DNA-binding protein [Pluralibacter gergoviae]MCS5748462.1 Arc family DNA-binding protein [Klebsiella quasipneumoniae subsp. quasipneumoniae]MCW9528723.1 Arc family DNA-binding protein [Klebsiella grimontii]MDK1978679.1 Arc family DNA-binding protein [Klebsiella sp. K4-154]DAL53213.1 MAG TPA_asm: Arc-like DNA binding domain protein [Caudoviricetes sp.]HBX3835715.1 Arc family DNA-binding protein [Klebsiella pneu